MNNLEEQFSRAQKAYDELTQALYTQLDRLKTPTLVLSGQAPSKLTEWVEKMEPYRVGVRDLAARLGKLNGAINSRLDSAKRDFEALNDSFTDRRGEEVEENEAAFQVFNRSEEDERIRNEATKIEVELASLEHDAETALREIAKPQVCPEDLAQAFRLRLDVCKRQIKEKYAALLQGGGEIAELNLEAAGCLQGLNEALESSAQAAKANCERITREIPSHQRELQRLQANVDACRRTEEVLNTKQLELRRTVQKLETRQTTLEKQLGESEEKLARSQRDVLVLEERLKTLGPDVEVGEKRLEELERRCANMDHDLGVKKQEIEDWTNTIKQAEMNRAKVEDEWAEKVSEAEAKYKALEEEAKKLESRKEELTEVIAVSTKDCEDLEIKLANKRAEKQFLGEECEQLNKSILQLRQENTDLAERNKKRKSIFQKLSDKYTALQPMLKTDTDRLLRDSREISLMETRAKELSSLVTEKAAQMKDLLWNSGQRLRDFTDRLNNLREEMDRNTSQHREVKRDVSRAIDELERLIREIVELKAKKAGLTRG